MVELDASWGGPSFVSALRVSYSWRSVFPFPLLSTSLVCVFLQAHLHVGLPAFYSPSRRIRCKDMSSRAKRYVYKSTGSGNSSISGEHFCNCGLRAPLQVSKSVANPGREYYSCPARRCRYFSWVGSAMHETTRLEGKLVNKIRKNTRLTRIPTCTSLRRL
ncbi:hypothetical protein PIB30_103249 [Stylosanthes scabra]|uniref:GRF-type domain-containing protein n=1 Tax=Stylosanthes scabra TaxID=79078 RepID=A0ABU6TXI8_9FABA|nr:hypothetical protein [Stylosanthes scabra]